MRRRTLAGAPSVTVSLQAIRLRMVALKDLDFPCAKHKPPVPAPMIRTLSPLWRIVQSPTIVITIDDVSSVTATRFGKGFSVSARLRVPNRRVSVAFGQ